MFAPECACKGCIERRLVLLHGDGLVREAIALFQQPVGLGGARPIQATQRIERSDEADREDGKHQKAQHIRGNAENAEPGGRQEQGQNGGRQQ